jgi:hypothetical protein
LKLEVFRDRWPAGLGIALAALVLLTIAGLAARMQTDVAPVILAGLGLAFGLMVYRFVTPDISVRREIGALIVGAAGGVTAGGILHLIAKRVVPRFWARARPTARPARAR